MDSFPFGQSKIRKKLYHKKEKKAKVAFMVYFHALKCYISGIKTKGAFG
jgi:hypothetical protein